MKNPTLLLFSTIILFSACKKEKEDTVNAETITYIWRLDSVTFEASGIKVSEDDIATILSIKEDDSYYKNYVSGAWRLENNILTLEPGSEENGDAQNYNVLEANDDGLVLQSEMTETEYYRDLEEFEEDEILTITEYFSPDSFSD